MGKVAEKQRVQKEKVVECVLRVIARDGADKVSIRSIADELGGTTGTITHYFRNKEALMLFALDHVMSSVWKFKFLKIEKGVKASQIIDEWLTILPTSKMSQENWRVWVSFVGYAVSQHKLIEEYRKHHKIQLQSIAADFKKYEEIGAITLNSDIKTEAAAFLSMMDGLGMDWVIDPKRYTKKVLRECLETAYGSRLRDT